MPILCSFTYILITEYTKTLICAWFFSLLFLVQFEEGGEPSSRGKKQQELGDTQMNPMTQKYGLPMMGAMLMLAFIIAVYF